MSVILNIRKNVFGLSQRDFAAVAGVVQGTVSRWERGDNGAEPSLPDLSRIRAAAHARGLEWDDALFFDMPEPAGAGSAVINHGDAG